MDRLCLQVNQPIGWLFINAHGTLMAYGSIPTAYTDPVTINVADINLEELDWINWYWFNPADYLGSPYWLVNAKSFEDAYELLTDWKQDYFRINSSDYSPNGIPINTESLLGGECKLLAVFW